MDLRSIRASLVARGLAEHIELVTPRDVVAATDSTVLVCRERRRTPLPVLREVLAGAAQRGANLVLFGRTRDASWAGLVSPVEEDEREQRLVPEHGLSLSILVRLARVRHVSRVGQLFTRRDESVVRYWCDGFADSESLERLRGFAS